MVTWVELKLVYNRPLRPTWPLFCKPVVWPTFSSAYSVLYHSCRKQVSSSQSFFALGIAASLSLYKLHVMPGRFLSFLSILSSVVSLILPPCPNLGFDTVLLIRFELLTDVMYGITVYTHNKSKYVHSKSLNKIPAIVCRFQWRYQPSLFFLQTGQQYSGRKACTEGCRSLIADLRSK